VSWEHWWIEAWGAIIETFPAQQFTMNLTNRKQVQRMKPAKAAEYRVLSIPVKRLRPEHLERIGVGVAQFIRP